MEGPQRARPARLGAGPRFYFLPLTSRVVGETDGARQDDSEQAIQKCKPVKIENERNAVGGRRGRRDDARAEARGRVEAVASVPGQEAAGAGLWCAFQL